jgi:hypothetical protein
VFSSLVNHEGKAFPSLQPLRVFRYPLCGDTRNAPKTKGLCPWRGKGFPQLRLGFAAGVPIFRFAAKTTLRVAPRGEPSGWEIPLRLLRPVTLPPPLFGVGQAQKALRQAQTPFA